MSILSLAQADEFTSPFYKHNEQFCQDLEQFIVERGGRVEGKYNAWSYEIHGIVKLRQRWRIVYKKSSFTSANLLLSSAYQNLLTKATWSTQLDQQFNADFVIRKRKPFDFIKKALNRKFQGLANFMKYTLIMPESNQTVISPLMEQFKELFLQKEIYRIEYLQGKLTIELRTEKHYFEYLIKLDTAL